MRKHCRKDSAVQLRAVCLLRDNTAWILLGIDRLEILVVHHKLLCHAITLVLSQIQRDLHILFQILVHRKEHQLLLLLILHDNAVQIRRFAVLLVLDLAVLAIGAVCGAAGVSLIMTAFIGLPMVADMLILLGGGAAVIAIALVVVWLAVWLFIRMVIGWVRLLVRLGHRWCRKEIAA